MVAISKLSLNKFALVAGIVVEGTCAFLNQFFTYLLFVSLVDSCARVFLFSLVELLVCIRFHNSVNIGEFFNK